MADLFMKFVNLVDDCELVRRSVANKFPTQDKLPVLPSLANDCELTLNIGLLLSHINYSIDDAFKGCLIKVNEGLDLQPILGPAVTALFRGRIHT